jgi:hypothetical protein
MKRNNGVVYISIGLELVLPNRQVTFIFFTTLCTCCASSLLHLTFLKLRIGVFVFLTFPEVTVGFLTACEDFSLMAKQKIHRLK